jgi:hypothetical protein
MKNVCDRRKIEYVKYTIIPRPTIEYGGFEKHKRAGIQNSFSHPSSSDKASS